jgi:hypothetical protein
MTINPENPLNLPFKSAPTVPDILTLLSTIRGDIENAVTPELSRNDKNAFVLISSVTNGVFVEVIILSKTGEYRTVEVQINTMMEMYLLKHQQYEQSKVKNKGNEGVQENDVKAWFSITLHVENDGFVSKTEYNYDKPVYKALTPEQWFIAPETPSEYHHPLWTEEQYRADLAEFPRTAGNPDWLK